MKKIALLALIIVSVSLNIAFIGVWVSDFVLPLRGVTERPQRRNYDHKERDYQSSEKLKSKLEELGIDKEEWEKLRSERREMREKITDLRRDIRTDYRELFELLREDNPDHEEIERRQNVIAEKEKQIQSLIIDKILEEKEYLSPKHRQALFRAIKQGFGNNKRGERHYKKDNKSSPRYRK